MTNSNGAGCFEQKLDPPLWRGIHKCLACNRQLRAHLYRSILMSCSSFLRGHPLRRFVEAKELFNAVVDRLISCPTIAPPTKVNRFLSVNGVEKTIRRMVQWATRPKPLLGLSQKIAGRRCEQPGPEAFVAEIADRRICQDTDIRARRNELDLYVRAYACEIEARLDEADLDAIVALRQIMTLLKQHGLDFSDEPMTRLGMFDGLPFGVIRGLANADGANPTWTYETARKACGRLATADRAIRKDAEYAGFGDGPEALLGYLRLCMKTQSPGAGGVIFAAGSEETIS